jgi:hypothetical protein
MATTGTKLPGLKPIPAKVDKELAGSLKAMQEALAIRLGQLGDPIDRAVTLRELIDSGLAVKLKDNPFNPNAGLGPTDFGPPDAGPGDLSIPPAPVSLTADGIFTQVILDWNGTSASAPYGNHAYTEIWRSRDNNLAGATLRATTTAFIYTDEVGYGETYYYWVRYVSTSDVQGPFNNTNGAEATTLQDIAAVMTELSETLADLPGYNLLATSTTAATVIKSSSQPSTRTNGDPLQPNDIWFDTDDGQIYTRNVANNAWVAGRDATLVNLFGTTSFTGSTLTSAMATAQSDIVTVTNAQSATATNVTNLTSTVNGNTSSISTLNTTTANINGDLNAMYVLQVTTETNGSVSSAGMVIGSNASSGSGAQSYVQFRADKFAIWNGASGTAPFIVSGGTVFIDSARIQDGAITNARIANLAVEEGKIANLAVTTGKIGNLAVTTAKIEDLAVTNAKINNLSATKITSDLLNSDRIDVDTLNVKHFDNVSADIFNQTGGTVPLAVYNSASQYNGSYPGDVINSVEAVYLPITVNNVRNGATYQVLYSAVLGDVRNGTLQYSFNGSTWVSLSPVVEADAGTFRTYAFMWQGTLTGMSSSQETVYWRMNFNVSGSVHNSTYQSMYVYIDNTT